MRTCEYFPKPIRCYRIIRYGDMIMISFIIARFSKILWLMVALLFMPGLGRAALGGLDVSFGSGGVVVTDVSGISVNGEEDLITQPDGKILVVGNTRIQGNNNTDITLIRYNTDGSLDPTFGNAGIVITDFGNLNFEYGKAIALQ